MEHEEHLVPLTHRAPFSLSAQPHHMTLTKHDHVTFSKYTDRIPAFLIPPQMEPRGSVKDQEVGRRKENQPELREIRTYDHLFEITVIFLNHLLKTKLQIQSDRPLSYQLQTQTQKRNQNWILLADCRRPAANPMREYSACRPIRRSSAAWNKARVNEGTHRGTVSPHRRPAWARAQNRNPLRGPNSDRLKISLFNRLEPNVLLTPSQKLNWTVQSDPLYTPLLVITRTEEFSPVIIKQVFRGQKHKSS